MKVRIFRTTQEAMAYITELEARHEAAEELAKAMKRIANTDPDSMDNFIEWAQALAAAALAHWEEVSK